MAENQIKLTCAICGHWWKTRSGGNPRKCPNQDCRSVRWKDGVDRRATLATVVIRMDKEEFDKYVRAAKAVGKGTSEWLRSLGSAAIMAPPVVHPDGSTTSRIQINQHIEKSAGGKKKTPAEIAASIPGLSVGLPSSDYVDKVLARRGQSNLPTPEQVAAMTPEQKKDYYENGCAVGMGYVRIEEDPETQPNPTQRKAEPASPSRLDVLMGTTVAKPEIFGRVHEVDGKTMHQTFRRQDDGSIKLISEYEVAEEEQPTRSWSEEIAKYARRGEAGEDELRELYAEKGITKWPAGFQGWKLEKRVAWLDANHPLDGW